VHRSGILITIKHVIITASSVQLLFIFCMITWLQKHMLPCAYKYFFGIDCPICGAQRSMLLLLQGNFVESFKIYPPLLFLLVLICLAILYLLFPSIIKAKFLKQYAVFVLIIISINYAYKIATGNL
jgi:hypothetical protein